MKSIAEGSNGGDGNHCPFVEDRNANKPAWAALRSHPSPAGMVAMNLIRKAGPVDAMYTKYASYMSHLPEKYGFRVLAAASIPPLERALVFGREHTTEEDRRRSEYTSAVAVHFPSSQAFLSCWSDASMHEAFPLREEMWNAGFEHVWLRCDESH